MRNHLHVVCAVIKRGDKILVCQRNSKTLLAGKWEFPGGKIDQGETAEEALHREIREELSLGILIHSRLTLVTHAYEDFDISLQPFLCEIATDPYLTQPLEPIAHEHALVRWMTAQEAQSLDWAAADVPILQELCHLFK